MRVPFSSRLREWEAALVEIESGSYTQCRRGVSGLRRLSRHLEDDLGNHLGSGKKTPRGLGGGPMARLRLQARKHGQTGEALRRAFISFQQELNHFNARGESRRLLALGRDLLGWLREYEGLSEEEEHSPVPLNASPRDQSRPAGLVVANPPRVLPVTNPPRPGL